MRVFVCTDHEGFWPVGTASVVIAENEEQARELLTIALRNRMMNGQGLDSLPFTLQEISSSEPAAHILRDGNY